ncbi:hypothetical protein HanPSC8_Chr11g0450621 [Helianthus annuus]|nr:hypothetical protein HanPSC8_Chr11g0450621 [Helianthus annuus]
MLAALHPSYFIRVGKHQFFLYFKNGIGKFIHSSYYQSNFAVISDVGLIPEILLHF